MHGAETRTWLVLRKIAGGKSAVKAGEKYAAAHSGSLAAPDEIDAAITRINAEGVITRGLPEEPSAN